MIHTKEQLKETSLVELKILCKKYGLSITGTKGTLITRILTAEKPDKPVFNKHNNNETPQGKKIIGIEISDTEKYVEMGKLVESRKAELFYYSMGVHYYIVNK